VRGLLVVNPRATTTSPRVIDVIVHALSDELDLDVTVTTHRGHGVLLGERALEEGLDIVVTLGGDGVVNEVVNGLLSGGSGPSVPLLATIPGGSGNVFARSLGLPNDAVEATGHLLDRIRTGGVRPIGLGTANDRWFVANAGLGIDAEIIAAMEQHRKAGHKATPTRYLATTLNTFFRGTDRRDPALTLTRHQRDDGGIERIDGLFFAIVQNTSPWTFYLGFGARRHRGLARSARLHPHRQAAHGPADRRGGHRAHDRGGLHQSPGGPAGGVLNPATPAGPASVFVRVR
jgi:hypothetical protein